MPVEDQIVASANRRNAIDRKAQGLIDGEQDIKQEERNGHRVDDGRGKHQQWVCAQYVVRQTGPDFPVALENSLLEARLTAGRSERQLETPSGELGFQLGFEP